MKRRKKGVARILGPAGMDYFVGRAGDKIRRKMLETLLLMEPNWSSHYVIDGSHK